eukprot:gene12758-16009_t
MSRLHSHAGSWYEGEGSSLSSQIDGWLDAVPSSEDQGQARAIIGPHAGYRFCGHVLAHAYKAVQSTNP